MDDKTWLVINRLWQENSSNSQGVAGWAGDAHPWMAFRQLNPRSHLIAGKFPLETSCSGGAVMFGKSSGTAGTRFRGIRAGTLGDLGSVVLGCFKLRHDCNGRPYVQARKVVNHESDGRVREGRVMLLAR